MFFSIAFCAMYRMALTMQEKELALKTRYALLAKKIVKNLQSRKFEAYYCESAEMAAQKALSLIPETHCVSWGGSVTLAEIGLFQLLKQKGVAVIDRDTAETAAQRHELMRQALLCDTYLTSLNAISEDGTLINVDSVGNRVAAIAFGPKSVIAVAGMNKVCKTVEGAVERARTYAAPINVHRCSASPHFPSVRDTPCIINGSCGNCTARDCMCSTVVQTRMCKTPGRIKVILVGETLGI